MPVGSRANDFIGHYAHLYGQVRIHVLHEHLMDHLPATTGPRTSSTSVAAPAISRSTWSAPAMTVTIVDPSTCHARPKLIELLAAEPSDVAARVRLVEADLPAARRGIFWVSHRADQMGRA